MRCATFVVSLFSNCRRILNRMNPSARTGFYANACSQKRALAAIEREFGPVIVGEWSLATDNCAMVGTVMFVDGT